METLISAIIAAVISIIGIFVNIGISRKKEFNQYTTRQRNEWLKEMRALCNEFLFTLQCNIWDEHKLIKLRYEIISRLNAEAILAGEDSRDKCINCWLSVTMKGHVSNIVKCKFNENASCLHQNNTNMAIDFNEIRNNIDRLQYEFNMMFKEEWEKVKQESRGNWNKKLCNHPILVFIYKAFTYLILPLLLMCLVSTAFMRLANCTPDCLINVLAAVALFEAVLLYIPVFVNKL